ncbi:MAG: hypothetical protein ACK506_15365 [Pirellula sp.]
MKIAFQVSASCILLLFIAAGVSAQSDSPMIDQHSIQLPSDHAAVLTRFRYLRD